jgi:hypothetical protein
MAPTVWLSQSCVEVTSVGVVAYQVEPGGGTGRAAGKRGRSDACVAVRPPTPTQTGSIRPGVGA